MAWPVLRGGRDLRVGLYLAGICVYRGRLRSNGIIIEVF